MGQAISTVAAAAQDTRSVSQHTEDSAIHKPMPAEQRKWMRFEPENRERTAEITLLFVCLAWPQEGRDRQSIRDLVGAPFDSKEFLKLVHHHRVGPIVFRNLSRVFGRDCPSQLTKVMSDLDVSTHQNTHQVLRNVIELQLLGSKLSSLEIPLRILKGLPLSQMAYGDIGVRKSGDIDLLIEEDQIVTTDRALRELGYQPHFDIRELSPRRSSFYKKHWKDLVYRNESRGTEVDLHWRLFRNREMPGSSLRDMAGGSTVTIGPLQILVLPTEENLLYLCVHGCLDGWVYLKSLVDAGAMVKPLSETELDHLADRAAFYGVLPEFSATMILVRRYLGMNSWSSKILPSTDHPVRSVLNFVDHALLDRHLLGTRADIPSVKILRFEMSLRRNLKYRLEVLTRIFYRTRMWQRVPLPDWLFWLYPVISPLEWILDRVERAWNGHRVQPLSK